MPTPFIASITPSSAPATGGTRHTIVGTALDAITSLMFGGVPATGLMLDSPTQLSCTAPPHAAGVVSVVAAYDAAVVFSSPPAVQAVTANGGTIAYTTADPEGDHYRLDVSTDNGTAWTTSVADEVPGAHTVTLSGLVTSTTYQVKLRAAPLTGYASAVVADAVSLTPTLQLTVSRTSTGKLLYDDFSGTLAAWSVGVGSPVITGGKVRFPWSGSSTWMTAAIPSTTGIYVSAKVKMAWTGALSSDARINVMPSGTGADSYEIGLMNTNNVARNSTTRRLVAGAAIVLSDFGSKVANQSEHACALKVASGAVAGYVDGTQYGPVNDAQYPSFAVVRLLGFPDTGGSAGDYVEFDDVAVMKSAIIAVSGLPSGYKVRCAGVTATSSSGTAVLDLSGKSFPQALVEVLNASNALVGSFSGQAWGGDQFAVS